ncbi:MAG TPA: DUF488 domain-containing protein [Nitrospiria bacterium]|nr:DUF488 domain-containing protein [Nitrospiria bacterium]
MDFPGSYRSRLFTVGHSNRTLEEFLSLLKAYRIETLIDLRTVPRSRYFPHFNRETLSASLEKVGIDYIHIPKLGGLRKAKKDSVNTGWKNASFRGFADYMQTREFEAAVEELLIRIDQSTCAILCAEAVPWKCHRSLVADALLVRGASVDHIMASSRTQSHQLTPFARVSGMRITYPDLLESEAS